MVNQNNKNRVVFFISDRTGITAEALGSSLLSQFEGLNFTKNHLSFIDTLDKVHDAVKKVNSASLEAGEPVLVFSTQIHSEFRAMLSKSNCVFFDFFETFISKMERSLDLKSSHTAGKSHGVNHNNNYSNRMSSINFALGSDDGLGSKTYENADLILIGVSRSGKTPSCLFMALQYGINAANYPLIEQDLENTKLPESLQQFKHKLFGLTINPIRLQKIRDERRSNSNYASLKQCQNEVKRAEDLYHSNNIPFIDTTQISIEEISAKIINKLSLR
ncbi:kinase/pyrophosphorylase [Candidatus Thioglobus sp.]|nr:kinase/pyrophosphorylase [Candidatus Thioglobus sp.]MDB3893191.1 kinase/pyrophosphorylase [Candidatus Thioglobus sp.]MDC0388838.1 kinase/pyrophosphorylase [Candidatus Thioglobus sp.]MDC0903919.1 kinase/pyrophosphorylase [Candidatus Thioglobus sp.]MDC0920294.1 kinase/pyrophosphorylase [Candidatus Thioglobus sp.]